MLVEGEKKGGRQQPIGLLTGFREAINDCGLIDLGFVGGKVTWEKSRGKTDWVQERLDREFANNGWCELFPQAELQVWDVSTSDHLSIFLQLHKQVYVTRRKHFKFENVWLREDECRQIVQNGWDDAGERDITEKIMFCGTKLQEWGGGVNKEYREKLQLCRERLQKLRSRRDTLGVNMYNEVR